MLIKCFQIIFDKLLDTLQWTYVNIARNSIYTENISGAKGWWLESSLTSASSTDRQWGFSTWTNVLVGSLESSSLWNLNVDRHSCGSFTILRRFSKVSPLCFGWNDEHSNYWPIVSRHLKGWTFEKNRFFFFFCIFLKDIVSEINLCNLTCELLKLTRV